MHRLLLLWLTALAACASSAPRHPSAGEQATVLRQQSRLVEAYAAFAQVLCHDESIDHLHALVELWDELGQPGQPGHRLAHCALAPWAQPYLQGLVALIQDDAAAAVRAFARAKALAKGQVAAWSTYRLGQAHHRQGAFDLAQEALGWAAAMAPERLDIRLQALRVYVDAENYSAAADGLRRLLVLRPSPQEVRIARDIHTALVRQSEPPLAADLEQQLETLLAAVLQGAITNTHLMSALELASQAPHPRVQTVVGMVCVQHGAMAEARRLLEQASKAHPYSPDAARILGVALHAADRIRDALPYLAEALRRDPFDKSVARRLADSASKLGDQSLARQAWLALTVLEPDNSEHFLSLGRVERHLGKLVAARRAINEGCRLSPSNIPLLFEQAALETQWALQSTSDHEKHEASRRANQALDALAKLAPEHPGLDSIRQRLRSL